MTPPVGANAISTPNTTTKLEITKTIGRKPRRYTKYTEAQSRPINHTRGTYVLTVRICYIHMRGSPEHNETTYAAADRESWRYRAWPEVTNEAHDMLVLELFEDCDLGVESVVENLHSMPGAALLVNQEPDLHECAAR